jgi:thiamine-monophosphate kinase
MTSPSQTPTSVPPLAQALGEFDLIERYFKSRFALERKDLPLGIGDDCALMSLPADQDLAVSSDVLVEGTHFFADVDPYALGHKSLAVNLSDLAACGARPKAFTLALTLPTLEASWLEAFSSGLHALAQQHDCALIGGDTTRGPLSIGITVFGEVPKGQAIQRAGAQAGDDVYVSGTLGEARWVLMALQGKLKMSPAYLRALRHRLETPAPRVALGMALRGLASSAMDLSDGLLGDIRHLLKRSQRGARLDVQKMLQGELASPSLRTLGEKASLEMMLQGGDDYELLFTAPKNLRDDLKALSNELALPLTVIGEVTENEGLALLNTQAIWGEEALPALGSYEHFYDQKN